jgi:hypothetical protein
MVVIHVGTSALAITPVAIDCPKCQGKTEKIGYKLDKANFYQYLFSCGFTLAR